MLRSKSDDSRKERTPPEKIRNFYPIEERFVRVSQIYNHFLCLCLFVEIIFYNLLNNDIIVVHENLMSTFSLRRFPQTLFFYCPFYVVLLIYQCKKRDEGSRFFSFRSWFRVSVLFYDIYIDPFSFTR